MEINGNSASDFFTGNSESDIYLMMMLGRMSYYNIRKKIFLNLYNIHLKKKYITRSKC